MLSTILPTAELVAVVSCCDDARKWGRIEVSWWVSAFTASQAGFLMWVQIWVGDWVDF